MTLPGPIEQAIARDLLALGVRQGGTLLVHASLRSLGLPEGVAWRAESAVRGLLEALGPGGALLMPALSYETVNADSPFFDVQGTPSCVGALPEYFRTRPGTLRSVHPTHSVCGLGPQAAALLTDHHLDTTPVGPRSPFTRLPQAGGQILFLGCGPRPNTSMHGVEEQAEPPYLFGAEVDYHVTLPGGAQARMRVRRHNFRGWAQRYDRAAALLGPGALQRGRVLQAECFLMDAAALWRAALAALQQDPLAFVEPEPV
jgi:aminoglycoside 3-N-acetyltransferase